jgi:hypothetical protein
MQTQVHRFESYFQNAVRSSYEGRLGLDSEISEYVVRMLCEFSEADNLYRLRDGKGRAVEVLADMVAAADPIYGSAPSFIAERSIRRYIGDYALFVAGMCPEAIEIGSNRPTQRPRLSDLVCAGKESYYIVSQFNVFEYEHDAPLFARLSDGFEQCVLGLAMVRDELWRTMNPPTTAK